MIALLALYSVLELSEALSDVFDVRRLWFAASWLTALIGVLGYHLATFLVRSERRSPLDTPDGDLDTKRVHSPGADVKGYQASGR